METKQKTKLERVKSFKDLPKGVYEIRNVDVPNALIELFPDFQLMAHSIKRDGFSFYYLEQEKYKIKMYDDFVVFIFKGIRLCINDCSVFTTINP